MLARHAHVRRPLFAGSGWFACALSLAGTLKLKDSLELAPNALIRTSRLAAAEAQVRGACLEAGYLSCEVTSLEPTKADVTFRVSEGLRHNLFLWAEFGVAFNGRSGCA